MSCEINTNLGLIKFNAVNLYLNKVVKPKPNTVINSRNKKLSVLRLEKRQSLIPPALLNKQSITILVVTCHLKKKKRFHSQPAVFRRKQNKAKDKIALKFLTSNATRISL